VHLVELHLAILEGEERPIAPRADILARMQFRAALADDDSTREDGLTAKCLNPEPLRVTLATIRGCSLTFLVRQGVISP
jgi:hypothetical protein